MDEVSAIGLSGVLALATGVSSGLLLPATGMGAVCVPKPATEGKCHE